MKETPPCVILCLTALSLLLVWTPSSQASVVTDFNDAENCKDSLYMGTAPKGFTNHGLKKICQRYKDKPRYATLYDPKQRIPVYSAYTLKKTDGGKAADIPWMYEPQLSSSHGSSNMEAFPQSPKSLEDNQAVLKDYAAVVQYERGLLNPDEHQATQEDKAATYTLTNVVPQIREFSTGPWAKHKDTLRRRLNNYCLGTAYMITGVTTRGHMIRRDNLDRVAVPDRLWTAYCCPDFDRNAPSNERCKFPSFAAVGLNDRINNHVNEMSIDNLEKFLKNNKEVDENFRIFYDNCVPHDSIKCVA